MDEIIKAKNDLLNNFDTKIRTGMLTKEDWQLLTVSIEVYKALETYSNNANESKDGDNL